MKRYIQSTYDSNWRLVADPDTSAETLDAIAHSEFETNKSDFDLNIIDAIVDNSTTSDTTLRYLCKQAERYYSYGGDLVACAIAMRQNCSPELLSLLYRLFVKHDDPSILFYISTNPNVPIDVLKQMKADDFWFIMPQITRRPETIKKELNRKLKGAEYR